MKPMFRSFTVAVVGLLCSATAVFSATLEKVEKEIADRMSRHKSVRFEGKYTQEYETQGVKTKSEGTTRGEYERVGRTGYRSRVETRSKMLRRIDGQPGEKTDGSMLMIHDGQYMYTLSTSGDQKSAYKTKLDPKTNAHLFDAAAMFKMQHESYDMRLLDDETVDGRPVYVIEANPKGHAGGAGRSISYYDKKSGMAVKTVAYDESGNVMMTSVTTKLETDLDISDDRFVFKAPPGVQVVDNTQAQTTARPAASADAEAKSSTEAKADKPDTASKDEKETDDKPKKKKKRGLRGLLDKLK